VEIIRNDDGTLIVPVEPERVPDAEGGEPLPAHQASKIIGEIVAELD
jgi:hypothetical protein